MFKAVALSLLFLNTAVGDHINDPEPDVTWTPPEDESSFSTSLPEANYSGLLFAGKYEFNWVVDVRLEDHDQESWAVGNLVTYYHVLTTQRAVDLFQTRSNCTTVKESPTEYRWSKDVYQKCNDIRIFYCQDHLWADYYHRNHYTTEIDFALTGWRAPKEIIRNLMHGSSDLHLLYDVAIIVLNRGIPPIPPRLGYMPTGYDYAVDEIRTVVKLDPTKDVTYSSPVCYVASFGRNSVNHREYYTLDYKVKFRVYAVPWERCMSSWEYICTSGTPKEPSCMNPEQYVKDPRIMCLQPRARVGTVCDHDKGAPVVCNGQVIGLVVRGVAFRHCANLYKIPFVAEPVDNYRSFLEDSVSYLVQPVPKKTGPTAAPPGSEHRNDAPSYPIGIYPFYLLSGFASAYTSAFQ